MNHTCYPFNTEEVCKYKNQFMFYYYNQISTIFLCVLMPAPFFLHLVPYLHQYTTVEYTYKSREYTFMVLFGSKFSIIISKIGLGSAPSNDTKHLGIFVSNISTKATKKIIHNAQFVFFDENKVQIKALWLGCYFREKD